MPVEYRNIKFGNAIDFISNYILTRVRQITSGLENVIILHDLYGKVGTNECVTFIYDFEEGNIRHVYYINTHDILVACYCWQNPTIATQDEQNTFNAFNTYLDTVMLAGIASA